MTNAFHLFRTERLSGLASNRDITVNLLEIGGLIFFKAALFLCRIKIKSQSFQHLHKRMLKTFALKIPNDICNKN